MDNELLVKSIREICKSNNITPSQLEAELGFGAGLISRWTKSSPSLDKIVDIADYFNVPLDKVVGRSIKAPTFVEALVYLTKQGKLDWDECFFFNAKPKSYTPIEDHIDQIDFSSYPDKQRRKHTFITEYNEGYITLQSYLIYNQNAIIKSDCALYLQPSKKSEPVYQESSQEDLLKLTREVLSYINIETIEDEALEYKKQIEDDYLKQYFSDFNDYITESNIPTPQTINNVVNSIPPQVYNSIDSDTLQGLKKLFLNPQMRNAIDSLNELKKYFDAVGNNDKK